MKKIGITLIIIAIIIVSAVGVNANANSQNQEYLRIHIRANSNSEVDQSVKYKVKGAIVKFLTPKVSECKTKLDAQKMLKDNLEKVEQVADKTLLDNGFLYKSKANLTEEEFPLRTYGELTLDAGFYDALIVELGDGKGDNWWCVVYPPLCFVGEGENYQYQSKILEIINGFFNPKEK